MGITLFKGSEDNMTHVVEKLRCQYKDFFEFDDDLQMAVDQVLDQKNSEAVVINYKKAELKQMFLEWLEHDGPQSMRSCIIFLAVKDCSIYLETSITQGIVNRYGNNMKIYEICNDADENEQEGIILLYC